MDNKKWIVVTGASSGIGKAAAKYLLQTGYNVVLTSRNKGALEAEFEEYNDSSIIIEWDLAEVDSIKEYAKVVVEHIGSVSGIVHCAGIQKIAPVHMIKPDKIREVFDLNVFAAISLVSAFSKKKYYIPEETSFVLISSISAHTGADGNSIYASSKGAIEGFVSGVSSELANKSIRINSLVPGRVQTPMVEEFTNNLSSEDLLKAKLEYPLGWGTPEDIAIFVEFLLSGKSKWITGQNYIIDGGHMTRTSH